MRAAATAALAAVTLAGCAIRADSSPRDIAEDHPARPARAADAATGQASGGDRIYLIGPGEGQLLRTAARDTDGDERALIAALLEGPLESELDLGMSTALPDDLELHSVRVEDGVVDIDVGEELLELPGSQLQRAVAQIVLTANEIDGAESVLLRVDGVAAAWPDGAGEAQTAPLTVYDYIGIAESAQPPYPMLPSPTTTSTTTTTTTLPPPTAPPPTTTTTTTG